MSKLEWQIFIASNLTMVISYWGIPNMWQKANEAKTSFMAELYYLPIGLMVIGIIIAVLIDHEIIKQALAKLGEKGEE